MFGFVFRSICEIIIENKFPGLDLGEMVVKSLSGVWNEWSKILGATFSQNFDTNERFCLWGNFVNGSIFQTKRNF